MNDGRPEITFAGVAEKVWGALDKSPTRAHTPSISDGVPGRCADQAVHAEE